MTHRTGEQPAGGNSRLARSMHSWVAGLDVREAVTLTAVGAWFAVAAGVVWLGALSIETRIAATLISTAGLVALTVGVRGCGECWRRHRSAHSDLRVDRLHPSSKPRSQS